MPPKHAQFRPGETGNPGGTSKAFSIRRALERLYAADVDPVTGEGALATETAEKFVTAARAGDRAALDIARSVIAEIDGPHKQTLELQGEIPLVIIDGLDTPEESKGDSP